MQWYKIRLEPTLPMLIMMKIGNCGWNLLWQVQPDESQNKKKKKKKKVNNAAQNSTKTFLLFSQ